MNLSVKVASAFDCELLDRDFFDPLPIWRRTFVGCQVVLLLQDMYKFNITHVYGDTMFNNTAQLFSGREGGPDMFARPLALRQFQPNQIYPIVAVFTRKYGFILKGTHQPILISFYSQPFTRTVWNCLYVMVPLVSLVFYLLGMWEERLFGRTEECTFGYEVLVAITAYCQHILPVQPASSSRRLAYFIFFTFSYIIYSFYTSNLLSHLVNDTNTKMTLEELVQGNYEIGAIENYSQYDSMFAYSPKLQILKNYLPQIKITNIVAGLREVMDGKMALYTDYITLYPFLRTSTLISTEEVCNLKEIEVVTNIKEYLVTTPTFEYRELFKIGTLRMKEAGLLRQLITDDRYSPVECTFTPDIHATMSHVAYPLTVLGCSYFMATLVLMAERVHYHRTRVWPYVD